MVFGINFPQIYMSVTSFFFFFFRISFSKNYISCIRLWFRLECRKWGFKRWGFKEIRGYLRKKAFFLRFLDFPNVLHTLRKRAKKGDFCRFPGRAARHPLSPHLLHPHFAAAQSENYMEECFGNCFLGKSQFSYMKLRFRNWFRYNFWLERMRESFAPFVRIATSNLFA